MKIHFVGIGGIGISAIARFMAKEGHIVTGSDISHGTMTKKLELEGIKITVPHSKEAIADQDLVIHSAIIKPTNIELVEARSKNIQIMHRKEALSLMLAGKKVYAVAGAHGKSTTTAMLASILQSTALIGAESKEFGSNIRFAGGEIVVFEADESDASFLNSNPFCAVVTNAEPEHMEYYDYDLERFYAGYREFLSLATIRVICDDDPFLRECKLPATRLKPDSDIRNITNLVIDGEPYIEFELKDLGKFRVWGFGAHIALDASLAILAALNELDIETIRRNLTRYKGIKKRFDVIASTDQLVVVDDYAHHPTEVEATLKSASVYKELMNLDKITAIWQPHKFSRTIHALDRFIECFAGVDQLIILPVWAASEEFVEIDFASHFAKYNPLFAPDVKTAQNLCDLSSGLVIGFGAGDITYQLREVFAR